MARTTFEGGGDGIEITLLRINDGASGGSLTNVVYNNTNVPTDTGVSQITFSNEHPAYGSLGAKIQPGTSTTYLRKLCDSTSGTRYVARRTIYLTASPVGNATMMSIYAGGTTFAVGLTLTTGRVVAINHLAASYPAGAGTVALSLNTHYAVELAYTPSASTAKIEWRVTNLAGTTVIDSYASTASLAGTATTTDYATRAPNATSAALAVDYLDDWDIQSLGSGWIGPPATAPTVNATSTSDTQATIVSVAGTGVGGALTQTIAQTLGATETPVLIATTSTVKVWTVNRSTTEDLEYQVTVNEAAGGSASDLVVVAKYAPPSTASNLYVKKADGTWVPV